MVGQGQALPRKLAAVTGEMASLKSIFPRKVRRAFLLIELSVGGLLLPAGCAAPNVSSLPQPVPAVPLPTAPDAARQGGDHSPMTVEEALQRARACNPRIQALRAAVAVAKQRKSAATDIEDPEALIAWGNLAVSDEFANLGGNGNTEGDLRTGGRVYIPNPFLMVPRVSARTAEFLAAKADLQAANWLVECDVRQLFGEITYLSEDMALVMELVRQNGEILKDVRARAEQGAATAAEVVTAAQRQLQTEQDLDSIRHRYQLAQRDLAALLELPPASLQIATNAATSSPFPDAAISFEPIQSVALRCRGDVAALRWRTVAAKDAYHEGLNVRIPWLKEVKAWHRDVSDEWWVGLEVSVPLFSWTKNHAQDVLWAQYNLAGVNETNGIQLVCREIHDALDEWEERRRQQTRDENEIAPLIAEMRQTLQTLKGASNIMPSRVAATEAQITESLRLELETRWRYQLARLTLERVTGKHLSELLERRM